MSRCFDVGVSVRLDAVPAGSGWYGARMTTSPLADAFGHHVWATLRLIDVSRELDPTALGTSAAGTYGSIVDTLRHLVGADASYLHVMSGGAVDEVEEETLDLDELRAVMAGHATAWQTLIADGRDPATIIVRHRNDGSETRAPLGIRLAQALHHGTDHRSQVCTVLTTLGVTPPEIDVWDYAAAEGRFEETEPTA